MGFARAAATPATAVTSMTQGGAMKIEVRKMEQTRATGVRCVSIACDS